MYVYIYILMLHLVNTDLVNTELLSNSLQLPTVYNSKQLFNLEKPHSRFCSSYLERSSNNNTVVKVHFKM